MKRTDTHGLLYCLALCLWYLLVIDPLQRG